MINIWHVLDEATRLRTCARQDTIYIDANLTIWLGSIWSFNCKGYRVPLTWLNFQRSSFIITIELVSICITTFNDSCVIKDSHGEILIYFGITRNWEEVVKTWSRRIWLKLHMNGSILKFFQFIKFIIQINSLTICCIGLYIFFFNDNIGIF